MKTYTEKREKKSFKPTYRQTTERKKKFKRKLF